MWQRAENLWFRKAKWHEFLVHRTIRSRSVWDSLHTIRNSSDQIQALFILQCQTLWGKARITAACQPHNYLYSAPSRYRVCVFDFWSPEAPSVRPLSTSITKFVSSAFSVSSSLHSPSLNSLANKPGRKAPGFSSSYFFEG